MNIQDLTAIEIINNIKKKNITCEEVLKSCFECIEKKEPQINAFLDIYYDDAIEKAKQIDRKIINNDKTEKLAGLPIAIKDNICIKNKKTTCASKILNNYISPYHATVIEKLIENDAIFIGKTNMDEFAMGSSTETSAFKITRNPNNINCIPGGSSGGSAACVAAKMVPVSLGSDTGGSIRQPAALCGIIGIKPTYGRVSRYGLIAFASSLDQIGVFSRSVEDIALILEIISGYDPNDSTSVDMPVENYCESLQEQIKDIKIGLPKEYFVKELDSEIKNNILNAVKKFEDLGCNIEEVSLPHTEYAVGVYYIIASSEASANLARYDGVKYGYRAEEINNLIDMYKKTRGKGFGQEVKRRIILGTYALSAGYYDAYYLKAQKVRTLIKQDFEKVFNKVDVLITPTSPNEAFKIGEKIDNPLEMYLSDIFTIPVNLAGLPAISIPCGFTVNKLPIGMQIIGKLFDEKTILKLAWNFLNRG